MPENNISPSQRKISFIFLLIFALVTISLAGLQLRNTIYNPMAIKLTDREQAIISAVQLDETERLQNIDTDKDGINDYEELTFYETSPYLPDTDSDGIDDKTEIENGTDPLCPKGETCGGEDVLVTEENLQDNNMSEEDLDFSSLFGTDLSENMNSVDDQLNLLGESEQMEILQAIGMLQDPNTLRQLLLNTGEVTEADLKNLSDEDLTKAVSGLFGEGVGIDESSSAQNQFDLNSLQNPDNTAVSGNENNGESGL